MVKLFKGYLIILIVGVCSSPTCWALEEVLDKIRNILVEKTQPKITNGRPNGVNCTKHDSHYHNNDDEQLRHFQGFGLVSPPQAYEEQPFRDYNGGSGPPSSRNQQQQHGNGNSAQSKGAGPYFPRPEGPPESYRGTTDFDFSTPFNFRPNGNGRGPRPNGKGGNGGSSSSSGWGPRIPSSQQGQQLSQNQQGPWTNGFGSNSIDDRPPTRPQQEEQYKNNNNEVVGPNGNNGGNPLDEWLGALVVSEPGQLQPHQSPGPQNGQDEPQNGWNGGPRQQISGGGFGFVPRPTTPCPYRSRNQGQGHHHYTQGQGQEQEQDGPPPGAEDYQNALNLPPSSAYLQSNGGGGYSNAKRGPGFTHFTKIQFGSKRSGSSLKPKVKKAPKRPRNITKN